MTRINSAILVQKLTDEHLLAEHREIKRLPKCYIKALSSGSINRIPKKFCLGTGHVTFFLDKNLFTLKRYKDLYKECKRRGFSVEDYSKNWDEIKPYSTNKHFKDYTPTIEESELLTKRISQRIQESNKDCFHYRRKSITKEEAILLLT